MPTDAKKVVYYGPKDIRIESQLRPVIESGEILIEVEAAAICGTDIKTYFNGNPRISPPQTMGHEFCGTIIETDDDVDKWKVGQHVTMATSIGCGECFYCKKGHTNLCNTLKPIGFHYAGAMAKWLKIPAKAIKDNYLVNVGSLDANVASLSEPLSCAINNLSKIPMEQIDSAVVIGLGPLGILHMFRLVQLGINRLVAVEADQKRILMAQDLGIKNIVTAEQFSRDYVSLSGADGFDLVVVTAPAGQAQSSAIEYARKGGYVSMFASLPKGKEMIEVNSRTIHYNELRVVGTSDSTVEHVAIAVEAIKQSPEKYARIITGTYPLCDFENAIKRIADKQEMKVVLIP